MVWRETFPPANELMFDAESERERRLAAQARAGADWALTALIARYQPTVTRYLTRLCGDQSRARELAERVFQRMERRLHGPQGAENLRLWLLRSSTEAGLEALRRPRRAQPPRLGATRVAGLLPEESGASNVIRGGISRLRNVVGAVSRQARPLVWQATDNPSHAQTGASEPGRAAIEPGPVDETLDTLDPREALRHRLIRLTLADLPYGDAQCLALHLVAGLNQAEVARALGITGSAARKRIVQGLALFSEKYQAAVRSLGLPEELGYGDALPRRIEEEGPVAEPEPEPMIVPEMPDDLDAEMGAPAPPTVPLAVDSLDGEGEPSSGVVYYASDGSGEPLTYADEWAGPDPFVSDGDEGFDSAYPEFAAEGEAILMGEASASPYDSSRPLAAAMRATPVMEPDAEVEPEDAEFDAGDAQYMGGGGVTRIAADAIVGPVVDALPVHSEPLTTVPELGSPGPRSTPLAYELASGNAAEASGVTMNWIDSAGMMAPLSFEAIVDSAYAGDDDGEQLEDDPWARSTILQFEASTGQERAGSIDAGADDEPIPLDIAGDARAGSPPPDLSIALDESDYTWRRGGRNTPALAPDDRSLTYHDPMSEAVSGALASEPAFDYLPERPAMDESGGLPVARTLEDLWDEASDSYGR